MKQTNERLCALAQQGDTAALDSLIENNKSSIGKVANDLFRSMNLAQSGLNLDTDDLKQDVYKRQAESIRFLEEGSSAPG